MASHVAARYGLDDQANFASTIHQLRIQGVNRDVM